MFEDLPARLELRVPWAATRVLQDPAAAEIDASASPQLHGRSVASKGHGAALVLRLLP